MPQTAKPQRSGHFRATFWVALASVTAGSVGSLWLLSWFSLTADLHRGSLLTFLATQALIVSAMTALLAWPLVIVGRGDLSRRAAVIAFGVGFLAWTWVTLTFGPLAVFVNPVSLAVPGITLACALIAIAMGAAKAPDRDASAP